MIFFHINVNKFWKKDPLKAKNLTRWVGFIEYCVTTDDELIEHL